MVNGGSILYYYGGKFGILGMILCIIKVFIFSKFLLKRVKDVLKIDLKIYV